MKGCGSKFSMSIPQVIQLYFFSCPLNRAQHTSTKLLHNERCTSKFSMFCVRPRKSAVKRDCCCLVAKSCPTLCNPMDHSPPGSSVHVISQARMLEWVAIFSPGDLPDPGIKPTSPAWQVHSLPLSYQGSPKEGWQAAIGIEAQKKTAPATPWI